MKQDSLYLAPFHLDSQEIIVTLGLLEFLRSKYRRVVVFRPIFDLDKDYCIEAINLFTKETVEEYISHNKSTELLEDILSKYMELKKEYDFILVEGFDKYKLQLPFELNLKVAKNLNSGFIAVLNGEDKTKEHIKNEIQISKLSIQESGCDYLATFINNTSIKFTSTGCINSIPSISNLTIPTMEELYKQTNATKIYGDDKNLNRHIKNIKVAAMKTEHFLAQIEDDDLVVVPSDRTDIILSCFLALKSKQLAHISGILLTGDLELDPIILTLLESLEDTNLVILKLVSNTYETILKLQSVKATISFTNISKIAQILGKFNRHVSLEFLDMRLHQSKQDVVTPIMFEYFLFQTAMKDKQNIVLPESKDDRILRAADILLHRKIVNITLLGNKDDINHRSKVLGIDLAKATIIDPQTSELTTKLANRFYEIRKDKGVLKDCALEILTKDYNYFATMLVKEGLCDGMVSGAVTTTAATVRPALQIIKTKPDVDIVSSSFFMCLDTQVLVFADCAINQSPTPQQLSTIAISSAATAKQFGIEPRVAMLSYSSGDSATSDEVNRIKEAVKIVRESDSSLLLDGPIQYDAAVDCTIGKQKMPESCIAGVANVLIFPDLNTGNNTYKAVQKSSGAIAVGPILQGLNGAVNDLSRGATVVDIVNTVAITAVQAQGFSK